MIIKQNKSRKENTKQHTINNIHNLELLVILLYYLWKTKIAKIVINSYLS